MNISPRKRIGLVTAALAIACGCSQPGAPSSSVEKAKVTGVVRRQGKPVSGGTIAFNPANVSRKMVPTNVAEIREDGTYLVETLVGGNKINVFPASAQAKQALKEIRASKGDPGPAGPGGFRSRLEVRAGDNTFDVEM